jgi:hypothetical protein
MFKKLTTTIAASALAVTVGLTTMQPAKADGAASTRNIILGAAAVVAGIAIENNLAHKNAQANSVQGYLPSGGTVYQDGHVVLPNGQSYYPGNYGEQLACNGQSCYVSGGNGNGRWSNVAYGNPRNDRFDRNDRNHR